MSYNQTWKASFPCSVATIPFGYYEGRIRKASGKLSYSYHGETLPQLGNICMNLSSCLAKGNMQIGDEIELISPEIGAVNCIEAIAKHSETIPYEVLIRLDKGIRRLIIESQCPPL